MSAPAPGANRQDRDSINTDESQASLVAEAQGDLGCSIQPSSAQQRAELPPCDAAAGVYDSARLDSARIDPDAQEQAQAGTARECSHEGPAAVTSVESFCISGHELSGSCDDAIVMNSEQLQDYGGQEPGPQQSAASAAAAAAARRRAAAAGEGQDVVNTRVVGNSGVDSMG